MASSPKTTKKDKNKEVAGLKSDKEGYLHKIKDVKKKGEWQKLYFRLAGSSLYFYSNEKDYKARGLIPLRDVKVEEQLVEKKNAISLRAGEDSFVIAAEDPAATASWIAAIKKNQSMDAVQFPLKGDAAKSGILFKAKKNIAGRAASSSLGKSLINKVLDDEIKQLIAHVKNIITVESGNKELADKLENNTIKIAVKGYFLWENKTIPAEEFLKIETPLKQALKLLLAVYNHVEKVKDAAMKETILDEKFTVIAVLLDNVKEMLTNLLTPHLKPKSIARIHETFDYIARRDFLLNAWNNESLKPDVTHVINFVDGYIKRSRD